MQNTLESAIHSAATRIIRAHFAYVRTVEDENRRRTERSLGTPKLLPVHEPETWSQNLGFNPFHVRSRSSSIALSIERKLKDQSYTPCSPSGFVVPKPGGGQRVVNVFQIADEVISNRTFQSLNRKNRARFSARAYAYRPGLTPHDALAFVRSEFNTEHRLFVAEFDFRKYFDTVSHDYIWEVFNAMELVHTPREKCVIQSFLNSPEPYWGEESAQIALRHRTEGIPQGTSISLFLANMVAAPMDRAIERLGVDFVRYADDTLIWSSSYEQICRAVDELYRASKAIGADVHTEKSPGIRLLTPDGTKNVEIESTTRIKYLGHSLGLRSLQMKPEVIEKIKKRIQTLIFANLLREPLKGTQDCNRLSHVDRDYVRYIWQLRRYLYGPLSENQVRRFQAGAMSGVSFEGVMSFFPMVDDDDALLALDAWISSRSWLALRKRARLLHGSGNPEPWGLKLPLLIRFQTRSKTTRQVVDLRIPSVRRIAGAIRTGVAAHGYGVVSGSSDLYLYE